MFRWRARHLIAVTAITITGISAAASAQVYPERPVKLVTQGAAGSGFGFSWPASFPMARIDQIMVRNVEPVSSWTLPRTGSDHLPVAARVKVTTS